jgi:hypothetical protein
VQDADEPVGELADSGMVAEAASALLIVESGELIIAVQAGGRGRR